MYWGRMIVTLVVGLGIASEPVFAAAVGSPASVLKKGKWIMALSGTGVQGRDLNGNASVTAYGFGHMRGFGLTNWLSVYGMIGAGYLEVDDPSIIKVNDTSTTNRFGANILVTGQLKTRIWRSANHNWEWDGSLAYVDISKRHRNKNEPRFHQWDVATSVAKSFGRIKPYLGVKWSAIRFFYRVRQNGQLLQQGVYSEDGSFGPFFGTDVYFGDLEDVILNVETSYVGGPEFDTSIQYLF